ncbi:MAG TPA: FAD-dependent oxidoreductase, partial [Desulfobacteraceae bacterium]|nr:FAD-dependent oxidoreductase [Desulfobacteraceae bacterium]
ACPFDALKMGDDGLPKVDQEKCTGCGTCEKVCPKNIIRLTSVTRRIMREYTEDECVTPCQRACPAGIDIREYIRLIKIGENEKALQVIKERNPFPSVIGRICPAPCEFECRRQFVDSPVAINDLKRFVADLEMETGKRVLPYSAPATGKQVAVVGGGVEGLSAAFFAARLGHAPTIFETTSLLGGLLRVAIPEDRLPQEILDWDIQGILAMGVHVKTSSRAGRDFTVPGLLKEGFESVFIASGGWDDRVARGDMDDIVTLFPGGYLLIDLLRTEAGKANAISCGRNVVIAGGGTMVPQAVMLCRQMGAESVTVLSRKLPENSSFNDEVLDRIKKNKASVIYNTGITKVYGEDDQLTHIEYTELDTGVKHILNTDTIFMASGRFPELVFVPSESIDQEGEPAPGLGSDLPVRWEGVEIYKEPANRRELGLLSSGDVISGYSAAVKAINGGRKAAASVHDLMYGIPLKYAANPITKQSVLQGVNHLEGVDVLPRNIMPAAGIRQMGKDSMSKGFSSETAVDEANRCLKCGLVCYERTRVLEEADQDR